MKFNIGQLEKIQGKQQPSFLEWMVTEEGKKKMALYVGWGGTLVLFAGSWCLNIYMMESSIHEYCLDKDKELLNLISPYSSEFESDPVVSKLSAVCQTRAEVDSDDYDRLLVFQGNLMDPVCNGCLQSSAGAYIGVPTYMTMDNIDLNSLIIKTNYNRWFKGFKLPSDCREEDTGALIESLTLTKEEKQFIMSFCMNKVNSWQAIFNTVAPPLVYFFAYNGGHALNKKLDLFSKPRWMRMGIIAMLGAIHVIMYVMWFNYGNLEMDNKVNKNICKTVEEVDAGISYYNKILKRNVLLRRIIGEGMEYYIQESGEYVPLFYQIPDATDISAKIYALNKLKEEIISSVAAH